MEYNIEFAERISRTIGINPLDTTPDVVRYKLESLLDEAVLMVFDHIGKEKATEDIIITAAEANIIHRVRSIYDKFMYQYEEFLNTQIILKEKI